LVFDPIIHCFHTSFPKYFTEYELSGIGKPQDEDFFNSRDFLISFRFEILTPSLESCEYHKYDTNPIDANIDRTVTTTISSTNVNAFFVIVKILIYMYI
jgi:hypothetical protein